jgi:SAM-dependent methyltransferase
VNASPRLDRSVGGAIFGTDAAGYGSARADYPAELYDRIEAEAGGLNGRALFEVGGGTGIATRALAARGPARLTVIEPDPVLADGLCFAGFETICAPFEAADLPAGSFDLGVAASSIHWVDPEAAHRKARRLLRPGGSWAIWWNVYRAQGVGDAFADALLPRLAGLAMPPSEAADRHYSLEEDKHRAALAEAGFGEVTFHRWRRERILSPARMLALYASFSFVRALPVPEREEVLAMIHDMAEGQFRGHAPNVVLTPLYLARA